MSRLKILAPGESPQQKAQARGSLFEHLTAHVLRHMGFEMPGAPNVNYAGMEIDIDGQHSVTGVPLYVECKCYATEVDSPQFQQFFGKYMTRWLKDKRCQGLFVALPGLNSHARGLYKENCENNHEITVRLFEEEQVLEAMYSTNIVARPEVFSKNIGAGMGQPGDYTFLYTPRGCFAVQFVISSGASIPDSVALFDSSGDFVGNHETIDYLTDLDPELKTFNIIHHENPQTEVETREHDHLDQIVEVRGSSTCFEYQFPASPEHFIGRLDALDQLAQFVEQVLANLTSSRGVVFEGNSGWGKSSLVLASVEYLKTLGHQAIAIDSRTATSSQFILRAVDYAISVASSETDPLHNLRRSAPITGFDGAVDALLKMGEQRKAQGKALFIFFDQFENIFSLQETVARIRDLFVNVVDKQTNIVLGFSWKTDLIGSTNDFPYLIRESILQGSKSIRLERFSDAESTALLNRLENEIKSRLRKDLRFLLSEFSQGYPWLLKKLCAHVKNQRDNGVSQQDIADSLLNVEQLFQDDLRGLTSEQEDTLRRIARMVPVSDSDIGDDFKAEVLQSLVDRRLIVRIGPKYDIYWDIFRDYLNTGALPVQENYILHNNAGPVFKHTQVLANQEGVMEVAAWREQAGLTSNAFYTLIREMRLLGIASIDNNMIKLQLSLPNDDKSFEEIFRGHLKEKLRRNRLVSRLLDALEVERTLSIDQIGSLLEDSCPYVAAAKATWNTYARTFGGWMDIADLATYNKSESHIEHYSPATALRQRNLLQGRSRGGGLVPLVQFDAIVTVSERIVEALEAPGGPRNINWEGIAASTQSKALASLEQLEFVRRRPGRLIVTQELRTFVHQPEQRPLLFAERIMKLPTFATFLEILDAHQNDGLSVSQVGMELKNRLSVAWKESTAAANAKIMLNWTRHAGLAPGIFRKRLRRSLATD